MFLTGVKGMEGMENRTVQCPRSNVQGDGCQTLPHMIFCGRYCSHTYSDTPLLRYKLFLSPASPFSLWPSSLKLWFLTRDCHVPFELVQGPRNDITVFPRVSVSPCLRVMMALPKFIRHKPLMHRCCSKEHNETHQQDYDKRGPSFKQVQGRNVEKYGGYDGV